MQKIFMGGFYSVAYGGRLQGRSQDFSKGGLKLWKQKL